MVIVYHKNVPLQTCPGGVTYQTLIGDEPLTTDGVHASPDCIVDVRKE